MDFQSSLQYRSTANRHLLPAEEVNLTPVQEWWRCKIGPVWKWQGFGNPTGWENKTECGDIGRGLRRTLKDNRSRGEDDRRELVERLARIRNEAEETPPADQSSVLSYSRVLFTVDLWPKVVDCCLSCPCSVSPSSNSTPPHNFHSVEVVIS